MKLRKKFLVEILGMVVCTSEVIKMKEHLPFCRKLSILCIESRVVVTTLSNFERETAHRDPAFLMGSVSDP